MFPSLLDSFRSTSASLANLNGSIVSRHILAWQSHHDSDDWLDYWKEQDAYLLTDYQLAM